MSAIERRIADFILENAHLLRDYSSQQLANSLRHQPVERGEVQPEARLQGLSGPEGVRSARRSRAATATVKLNARRRAGAQRSACRRSPRVSGAARRRPNRKRA